MDFEQIAFQLEILNRDGLYESSELLGSFFLSSSNQCNVEIITGFADSLFAKEEWRRAMYYYNKASGQLESQLHVNDSSLDKRLAQIRFQIGKCHIKLGENQEASSKFESIPLTCRTISMNITIARHYKLNDNSQSAIFLYKEILRLNPFALEAVMSLLQLGCNPTEIRSLRSDYKSSHPTEMALSAFLWIDQVIDAHFLQLSYEYQPALEAFIQLESRFPNNIYLLENIAKCEVQSGQSEKAMRTFERMIAVDQFNVSSMDAYGSIIKSHGDLIGLNRLCQNLLKANDKKPETWTAVALYAELKGSKEKALQFVERALDFDDRHVVAYLLKGNLLLSMGRTDQAVIAFKKAYNLHKNILAFSGLVRSFVVLEKIKEALAFAKEGRRLMPHSPQALTLVGLVLSQPPDPAIRKKARQCFEEALKMDKSCLDAVLGISQLNVMEEKMKEAVEILEEYAQLHSKDFLYARLAEVLVLSNKYTEAITNYNIALSLNPNCELAKNGIDRLEKIMKGVDPDAVTTAPEDDTDIVEENDNIEEENEDDEDDFEDHLQ